MSNHKEQGALIVSPVQPLNQSNAILFEICSQVTIISQNCQAEPTSDSEEKANVVTHCSLYFDEQFVAYSAQKTKPLPQHTTTYSYRKCDAQQTEIIPFFPCWSIKNTLFDANVYKRGPSETPLPVECSIKNGLAPNTPAHWLSSVKVTLIPVNIHTLTQMANLTAMWNVGGSLMWLVPINYCRALSYCAQYDNILIITFTEMVKTCMTPFMMHQDFTFFISYVACTNDLLCCLHSVKKKFLSLSNHYRATAAWGLVKLFHLLTVNEGHVIKCTWLHPFLYFQNSLNVDSVKGHTKAYCWWL